MCQVLQIGQAYDLITVLSGLQPLLEQVFHPPSAVSLSYVCDILGLYDIEQVDETVLWVVCAQ